MTTATAPTRPDDPSVLISDDTWAVYDGELEDFVTVDQPSQKAASEALVDLLVEWSAEGLTSACLHVVQVHVHEFADNTRWTAPANDCEVCGTNTTRRSA